MGKFKNGLFFGGALGAALTWMGTTKRGKEVRSELVEHAAKVYVEVKKQVMKSDKWQDLSQNEYVKKVQDVVEQYAKKHGLPDDVKSLVSKVVQKQWKVFQGDRKQRKSHEQEERRNSTRDACYFAA